MIEYVAETDGVRETIQTGPNLYGEDVGESIVEFLSEKREATPFDWAHERVGFETGEQDFEYL